jgi:two-component system response regulator YesN
MIRVLIVDDDNLARWGLKQSLPWDCHDMKVAGDAGNVDMALQFIKANPVDLVIVDLEMPGLSGIELLKIIGRSYPKISCVVLTMHQDFQYVQEAIRLGALDYILKVELDPQNFGVVLERIRQRMKNTGHLNHDTLDDQSDWDKELGDDAQCSSEVRACIVKAVKIIHEESTVHLNAVDVAQRVNMSRSYFSSCFKKLVGKPFNEYFRQVRMEQAKVMLLNSKKSIQWIASACGFTDVKYFSQIFKQYAGKIPRDYRNSMVL